MTADELILELTQYAGSKRSAETGYQSARLSFTAWGSFLETIVDANGESAHFPVSHARLTHWKSVCPAIRESNWMPRDGHVFMHVPLDANLDLHVWKQLIDEAYELTWGKVQAEDRFLIDSAVSDASQDPEYEFSLLAQSITRYGLQTRREEIFSDCVRPSACFRTRPVADEDLPLGTCRLGGQPDLPAQVTWPRVNFPKNPHHNRPLAFLAQFDLAAIDRIGVTIPDMPRDGLLSLFSAYGWIEEGNDDNWQPATTVLVHTPAGTRLERREIPVWLMQFQQLNPLIAVPELMLSLPNHRNEPDLARQHWDNEEFNRFDEMQMAFRSVQMDRRFRTFDTFATHHRYGGFATFPQMYPDELADSPASRMLIQLGSDDALCWGMNWAGDGGDFVVYVERPDESLDRVSVFIQGSQTGNHRGRRMPHNVARASRPCRAHRSNPPTPALSNPTRQRGTKSIDTRREDEHRPSSVSSSGVTRATTLADASG